jgi:ABC-2 type transport system ATP-binding protein
VKAGMIGAMTQTGQLIEYLSVRELITMMAAIYPAPLDVEEALSISGADRSPTARPANSPAARPSACASPSRWWPTPNSWSSTSRRWRSTSRGAATSGAPCAPSPRAARRLIFATHYLEEADAYADRIVLMSHGRIVADGAPTEIKATVGGRIIRATLPGVDVATLHALSGVTAVDRKGDAITLNCSDSDATLRDLFGAFP